MKLLLFLAALAAEGRWQLHRCENYRKESPKNAHTDPKIVPSAPIRSNSNSSVLQSQLCPSILLCTAPPRPVLLPSPSLLDFSPMLTIRKWETAQAPHTSSLFKFAALEASSPVQLHSSILPLLPPCIKILTRSKSLNP